MSCGDNRGGGETRRFSLTRSFLLLQLFSQLEDKRKSKRRWRCLTSFMLICSQSSFIPFPTSPELTPTSLRVVAESQPPGFFPRFAAGGNRCSGPASSSRTRRPGMRSVLPPFLPHHSDLSFPSDSLPFFRYLTVVSLVSLNTAPPMRLLPSSLLSSWKRSPSIGLLGLAPLPSLLPYT